MKKQENEINPEVIPLTPPGSTPLPIKFLNENKKIEHGFFHCWTWIQLRWHSYITNEDGKVISYIYLPEVRALIEDSEGTIHYASPFDLQFLRENKANDNQNSDANATN